MNNRVINQYRVDVRCPSCMRKGKFTIKTLLDTQDDPEAAVKVLNGDSFVYSCKRCGTAQYMSYSCMYHDGDKKILIGCADTPASWEDMHKQLTGDMDDDKLNAALKTWLDTCTVRLVTNPGQVQELVLLSQLELDDRIVQIAKQMILRENGIDDEFASFNTMNDGYVISAYVNGEDVHLPFAREFYDELAAKYAESFTEDRIVYDRAWALEVLGGSAE